MTRVEVDGGPSFECGRGDTILRAALRAGLGFPYACNVGSCGN
ncbi:MAG TPA: 2Fe-2S iron-sulfur cluster-binding protein, partial [Vicinamibacteria bacterium]|nr:2Fe-2S iron-sulfur cluster-binding protein [Vicinamibacteria bacterium]